jgi:hypothetical protein
VVSWTLPSSLLSVLHHGHEVSGFAPAVMYCLTSGPKQGANGLWTAACKTASQSQFFSYNVIISGIILQQLKADQHTYIVM